MAWSVYVIEAEGLGRCKVGIAIRPDRRLSVLRHWSPVRLVLIEALQFDDPGKIERAVHRRLRDKRLWGEWFEVSAAEALAAIMEVAQEHGVSWMQWVEPRPSEIKRVEYCARDYPL